MSIVSSVWQQSSHQSKHTFCWTLSLQTLCPSAGGHVGKNNPAVRVSSCRHSVDRWAKETLDAVTGLEINSEPHCNRRSGRHRSYLRGIWHLSHFDFCLFLPLRLFLSTGFLILHSHVWCSTNVISTYSWPGSAGLIFNSCIVTFVVWVGWHSSFSSPQQPAHLTSGTQEGL